MANIDVNDLKKLKELLKKNFFNNKEYLQAQGILENEGIGQELTRFDFSLDQEKKNIEINVEENFSLIKHFFQKYNVRNIDYSIKNNVLEINSISLNGDDRNEDITKDPTIVNLEEELFQLGVNSDIDTDKNGDLTNNVKLNKTFYRLNNLKEIDYKFKHNKLSVAAPVFNVNVDNKDKSFELKYSNELSEIRNLGLKMVDFDGNNPKWDFTTGFLDKFSIAKYDFDNKGFDLGITSNDFSFDGSKFPMGDSEELGEVKRSLKKTISNLDDKLNTLKNKIKQDKNKEDTNSNNEKEYQKKLDKNVEEVNSIFRKIKDRIEALKTDNSPMIVAIQNNINEALSSYSKKRDSLISNINDYLSNILLEKSKVSVGMIREFFKSDNFQKIKAKTINVLEENIRTGIGTDLRLLKKKRRDILWGIYDLNNMLIPSKRRRLNAKLKEIDLELSGARKAMDATLKGVIGEIITETYTDLFLQNVLGNDNFDIENAVELAVPYKTLKKEGVRSIGRRLNLVEYQIITD